MCLEGWDPLSHDSNGISALLLSIQSQNQHIMEEVEKAICRQFTTHIQKQQKTLLYRVWLGFIPDEKTDEVDINNVRIVALCNSNSYVQLPKTFRKISIYWRLKYKISEEAKEIAPNENIGSCSRGKVTGEEAQRLFKLHRNLSIIHVSSFRSTKFSTVNSNIVTEQCVALYCQIKGIVPIGEKTFPKKIGNLRTDIREGFAAFGAGEMLRPGIGIKCPSTNKSGTIGGFVELPDGKVALITTAHLIAKCEHLESDELTKKSFFESGISLSRASDVNDDQIGTVITASFSHGVHNQTSVDAALVEIRKQLVAPDFKFQLSDNDKLKLKGKFYHKLLCNFFPRLCKMYRVCH